MPGTQLGYSDARHTQLEHSDARHDSCMTSMPGMAFSLRSLVLLSQKLPSRSPYGSMWYGIRPTLQDTQAPPVATSLLGP